MISSLSIWFCLDKKLYILVKIQNSFSDILLSIKNHYNLHTLYQLLMLNAENLL